jgi:hypothetical protein
MPAPFSFSVAFDVSKGNLHQQASFAGPLILWEVCVGLVFSKTLPLHFGIILFALLADLLGNINLGVLGLVWLLAKESVCCFRDLLRWSLLACHHYICLFGWAFGLGLGYFLASDL